MSFRTVLKPLSMLRALHRLYKLSLEGTRGIDSAYILAEQYEKKTGTLENKIDALVRWQSAKCATTGFLSGLGGVATLVVALPFDATINYFVQIRMITSIAILTGHDPHSPKVKNMVLACLVGNALGDALKDAGVVYAKKSAAKALAGLSSQTIRHINRAVGMKLLAKSGRNGFVKLHHLVPVVGGLVGGGLDMVACRTVGGLAKKVFFEPEIK